MIRSLVLKPANRVSAPDAAPLRSIAALTRAQIYVDENVALSVAAVFGAIRYLAFAVAQLPWKVMRPLETGGAEHVSQHPADWVLRRRPNQAQGSFAFRVSMIISLLLYGDAFAEISRNLRGEVTGLWPIHPTRVAVKVLASGVPEYEVQNGVGAPTLFAAKDIYHISYMAQRMRGRGLLHVATEVIGWSHAAALFSSSFFGQGLNAGGMVTAPEGLTEEAMQLLEEQIAEKSGPNGWFRPLIGDKGMKFERITITPDEAQFSETLTQLVLHFCAFLGVPPHKVAEMSKASFSNIEHQSIEVVMDSITPLCRILEEEADYKLLNDNRGNVFSRLFVQALLRGDHAARGQFYHLGATDGWLLKDDIRELEDLTPLPDGLGKVPMAPVNTAPLKRLIDEPKPEPEPAPPPTDPPLTDKRMNGHGLQI